MQVKVPRLTKGLYRFLIVNLPFEVKLKCPFLFDPKPEIFLNPSLIHLWGQIKSILFLKPQMVWGATPNGEIREGLKNIA